MVKEFTTLIIVDDDDVIRRSLERNIPWDELEYRVVGAAEDGIAGLELIEEFEPDIVITDILMPCMDGLSMLKEIKIRGYHPRTIILSGYDEFEYARTAISLSVDAYIDKPLDRDKFIETLNQSREKLESEHRFAARAKKSLPLLRQVFFSRLFSGYYHDPAAVKEQTDFLEISMGDGPFLCVAARLDPLCPEIKKRNTLGKEFLKDSILKLVREGLENFYSLYHCDLDETGFVLLLETGKDQGEKMTAISQRLEELIHSSRSRYKIPLTLGLSGVHTDISGIVTACQEATKALSCAHIFGNGRIISIQDLNLNGSKTSLEMHSIARELAMAIRFADSDLAEKQLSGFNQKIREGSDVPMVKIKMDASAMAFAMINEADSWLKEERAEAQEAFDRTYKKIQQAGAIEETLDSLRTLAFRIIELIENTRLSHHQTIIHRALHYIEANYQNNSLSLEDAASSAGVSQSHLCFLFKKKINTSFQKYLTKVRMERAVALFKETDFKTYEIAEMVGYGNAQYFSVSFKKHTGYSPLHFRDEIRQ
jgi:two-component system response regulator YesN